MAKKSSDKKPQTAPAASLSEPVSSPPASAAAQVVSEVFPPGQHPLSEPIIQPEHETGLIAPLSESAPAEATNQPTAETPNPPEAETQPPPSTEGAGDGEVDAQNLPSPSLIKRAGAYQTPAGKPSNVIRRYVTPPPPDVLAGKA